MNDITHGQSVPELTREIADAALDDVCNETQCFRAEARIVLHGTVSALVQRQGGGGFFTRKELADALRQPPREFAAFAAQGDPTVRAAVPCAFGDGELSRSDKAVLSVVAAVGAKLAA